MTELAAVRAQIKAWERDFRSARGRDPSIQDIKDQPHIADKYKLYKKLSKSVTTTTTTCPTPSASQNPSTPPRTRSSPSRTSAAIPKSRKAEAVAPLPGFNPFSPVKNKGKERDTLQVSRPSSNPFATPTKQKPSHANLGTRSPDLFPSIVHTDVNTSPQDQPTNPAVSRARKRLRGEPVSPSPNKQKRQRFGLQVSPLEPEDRSDNDDNPNVVAGAGDVNAPFIGDSPVKAPAGGKSFKLLFDDTLPALSIPKRVNESAHFPHSKSTTLGAHSARDSRDSFARGAHRQIAQAKSAAKRTSMENEPTSSTRTLTHCPLVPPSPPPEDLTGPGKLKGGFGASRKKPRVELQPGDGDDSDEGGGSSSITVKVIAESHRRLLRRNVDDLDCDPLLNLHAQDHDPITTAYSDANRHESGTFNVDLPDKLRHVLAISPSRDRNRREERVVRGLLYGDQVDHYDPSRGGEIWDAGEWDDGVRDPDAEDDWEGEPVPWEVGEL
ncbi:hypothetical protein EDD16DRAFT_1740207 [Pisolithus croceorrhizus]|nr:hypothetical protein EDD16DRAFT_1740207 [Pisolithus croceorrhizus]